MAEYVVVHGSIRTADGFIETRMVDGELELGLLELTPKEAKKLDPTGACLQLRTDYDAEQEAKAAAAARKKKAKAAPEPEVAGVEEVEEPAAAETEEAEEPTPAKRVRKPAAKKRGG